MPYGPVARATLTSDHFPYLGGDRTCVAAREIDTWQRGTSTSRALSVGSCCRQHMISTSIHNYSLLFVAPLFQLLHCYLFIRSPLQVWRRSWYRYTCYIRGVFCWIVWFFCGVSVKWLSLLCVTMYRCLVVGTWLNSLKWMVSWWRWYIVHEQWTMISFFFWTVHKQRLKMANI